MRELRTGIVLAIGALIAGLLPFLSASSSPRNLGAAAALSVPAMAPFFFRDRSVGLSAVVLSLGLVMVGSVAGLFLMDSLELRRVLLVRNLQMASVGAVAASFLVAISWAREMAREADEA
ncbi:MAG: hypothetical protein ABR548_15575 [Actinomycetota bacterium]|nr:hypothetical protein [Actinomycetota bacterium]